MQKPPLTRQLLPRARLPQLLQCTPAVSSSFLRSTFPPAARAVLRSHSSRRCRTSPATSSPATKRSLRSSWDSLSSGSLSSSLDESKRLLSCGPAHSVHHRRALRHPRELGFPRTSLGQDRRSLCP